MGAISQEDISGELNRRFEKILGNYRDASDRIKCEPAMPLRLSLAKTILSRRQEQRALQGFQAGSVGHRTPGHSLSTDILLLRERWED
jgi:hypothetical protein